VKIEEVTPPVERKFALLVNEQELRAIEAALDHFTDHYFGSFPYRVWVDVNGFLESKSIRTLTAGELNAMESTDN